MRARKDPERKRFYWRKLIQKGMGKARIAAAPKLGIGLGIMMRDPIDYEEFCRRGKLRQSGEAHAEMRCATSSRLQGKWMKPHTVRN